MDTGAIMKKSKIGVSAILEKATCACEFVCVCVCVCVCV